MKFLKKWFGKPDHPLDEKVMPGHATMPEITEDNVENIIRQTDGLQAQEGLAAAVAWLEQRAFDVTDDPRPLIRLCELYIEDGQTAQAEEILDIARHQYPDDLRCLEISGKLAVLLKKGKPAEQYYRNIIERCPDSISARQGLVRALHVQEKFSESLPVCEEIQTMQLQKSVHDGPEESPKKKQEEFFTQYILTLYYVGQYSKALEMIGLCKEKTDSRISFDVIEYVCRFFLGQLDKSEVLLEQLLRKNPHDASLHYGRAILKLIQHDFLRGWPEYRYRLRNEPKFFRMLPFPEWHGESLKGKKIVIALEQGLGDQIMFASCLPDLQKLEPDTIYLETHARLETLFQRTFPNANIIPTQQDQSFDWLKHATDADCYVQLGELPGFFRTDTGCFPHHDGYLVANPALCANWKQHLKTCPGNLKVGFCWKGGIEKTRSHIRSIMPEQLAPLFALPGITWVNLQFGTTQAEIERLPTPVAGSHLVLPEQVGQDMDELAAIIDALDLVVTVCNTVVHMAGALGKPALVLTPYLPEWRYGMKDRMPWYPAVQLFRQAYGENAWETVLDQVGNALRLRLDENSKFSTIDKHRVVLE